MKPGPATALKYGAAAAIVAFFITFQPLCQQTYSLIFAEKAPFAYSALLSRQTPIPMGMVWSNISQSLILRLGTLSQNITIVFHVLLWAVLVYSVLRLLNTTFRLTSGVDWDKGVLTQTYMHTPPLIKVFLIAVAVAIPAFVVHLVVQTLFHGSDFSIGLRLVLSGAAVWLLFSGDGVAGDCESGNYDMPRDKGVVCSLLFRGAMAGLAAFAIVKIGQGIDPTRLFEFFATLGGIGDAHWRWIVLYACGTAVALGFAGAIGTAALGLTDRKPVQRLVGAAVAACMLLSIWLLTGRWLPIHLKDRYDFTDNLLDTGSDGRTVASLILGKIAGLTRIDRPETVVIMLPRGPQVMNVVRASPAALSASPGSAQKVEAFLRKRDYLSSLSDPAFKTLHDAASLNWDSTESLRIDYLKLSHCPDGQFLSLFVDKLRTCASTAANLHYADLMADETRFTFPTRESLVAMGDIYARFGERKKAETWYKRAEIPPGRIDEILSDRTMFPNGEVFGRLTLNGKPAAGYEIGLFPSAITSEAFQNMLAPGLLRPYWLRWIGPKTLTGPDGRFRIENIVATNYCMIVSGPELRMRSFSRRLSIRNAPEDIFVGFGRPKLDLGEIALTVQPRRMPAAPMAPTL